MMRNNKWFSWFSRDKATWNSALDAAAYEAYLRSRVFGGEPTTRNEQMIAEHIRDAILELKVQ